MDGGFSLLVAERRRDDSPDLERLPFLSASNSDADISESESLLDRLELCLRFGGTSSSEGVLFLLDRRRSVRRREP